MNQKYFILIFLFASFYLEAQFLHPTTGINSEYVGACQTATCGGTYLDNGGSGANYSNNISSTYRVFCPNTAGNCIRLTFTSFTLEPKIDPAGPSPLDCYYDYLTIGNGPTQNSTLFTSAPATATGRICAQPATPFSFTSTDASGCLTVRFKSDGTVNLPGWSANISCVPCAGGPTGTTNSDCNYSTPLCSNAAFSANSTGPGIAAEGCNGATCPAGGENFSNWYQILINTSGTLNFTITPSVAADFDFAVYGPNPTCGALGAPIRCSDSGLTGNTGLSSTAVDNTETVAGDSWCATMNVVAGQTYFIVVDSWSPPSGNYNLSFGGTSTFNCAVLPVEMVSFSAEYSLKDKHTELRWVTARERNIDYYSVERSTDAYNFKEIGRVLPYSGNSNNINNYFATDPNPVSGEINYYRIITVETNGHKSVSTLQAVAFQDDDANLMVMPNPASDNLNVSFKSEKNKYWTIAMMNSKGDVIMKNKIITSLEGINETRLSLTELPEGLYFVTINDGVKSFKRKFIKK